MSLVVLILAEAQDDVVGPPDLDAHADVEVDHESQRHQEEADGGHLQERRVDL